MSASLEARVISDIRRGASPPMKKRGARLVDATVQVARILVNVISSVADRRVAVTIHCNILRTLSRVIFFKIKFILSLSLLLRVTSARSHVRVRVAQADSFRRLWSRSASGVPRTTSRNTTRTRTKNSRTEVLPYLTSFACFVYLYFITFIYTGAALFALLAA